jgi:hypothetical protein
VSITQGLLILFLSLPVGLRAENPPAWVQNQGADPGTYPDARYLTGYGLSTPGGTEADQRRQALAMARDALASSIRTHVTSEFSSRVTQQDKHMSHYAQNLVRTRADLELDGLDTLLTWQDGKKNITYALAVLDKVKTLQLLDTQLRRQAGECASLYASARAAGDTAGLIRAQHLREGMEEQLLIHAVLSPGATPTLPGPSAAEINGELRRIFGAGKGLDGYVALAALDLSADLPKGINVLMDRITFSDTPFCGSLSAYLEPALSSRLAAFGQVKILDKTQGRNAIQGGDLSGDLASAMQSQAAVRGTINDLGEQVNLILTVNAATGEQLATASVDMPALLIRKAGLKLVPDNYQEARQALAICDAQVQATKLQVKLVLDRGNGGIYRKGDRMHLFLKANMDCYVKLLYHQVDGTKVLIFPNKYHPDARIQKDRLYQIPPDDNSFELQVEPPFGSEMVKLIACTDPIDVQGNDPDVNGLSVVRDDLASLLGRTRSILLKKAEVQYSEATAVVNTMEAVN